MLAIETTQPPPLFRKASIFRRFTRKERPLEISSPIIAEANKWNTPQSPRSPRKLVRRSPERQLERVAEVPPTLPPLSNSSPQKPKTFITHIRVDSGTFPDLPISQQFSRARPASPVHSRHSSQSSNQSIQSGRPSTDTTSSTHSRVSRSAHATSQFPHNTRIGPWDLFLPPSQVHALYTGFFPENMSDEWFVFSEGPDVNGKLKVHFHQAWTGLKVAELFVVMDLKGEGAGKIVGVKWNASEQTSRLDEEEAKRSIRRGCKNALGIELEGGEF
ncbi:hypothetical protein E8E12_003745 [Didymella heteroderae]|uniref:Uncharacterized protein n=1 Tax=Didymella heteroderae TaxID=1769908 RepID=A0A9P4WQ35_9PLEO|nr:hypothetical protein E8E12_003745 [Didymella heteroderae]